LSVEGELPALLVVDIRVIEAALVADEPALGLRVLARADAVDDVLVVIDVDAAAGRAAGADAALRLEEPDALFVQEILVCQGADRAQIDDVARQRIVDWIAREDVDLAVMPAIGHLQFGAAGNLAREADAARAHDAAVGEQ
jgi:hypothetical protein